MAAPYMGRLSGPHGPWHYNTKFKFIAHCIELCPTCSTWMNHFTQAAIYGNPTFASAEAQLVDDIQHSVLTENVTLQDHIASIQRSNTALQQTLDLLHREIDVTHSKCDEFNIH